MEEGECHNSPFLCIISKNTKGEGSEMDKPISPNCRYIPEEGTYVLNGNMLVYVSNDAQGIVDRLKEFDPDYFVMFNPAKQKYEIHSKANTGSTYCMTAFKELDFRTIEIVRKSHITRAAVLFKEMQEANEKADKSLQRERQNAIEAICADELFPKYNLGRQYFC